jgi:hypothetical protein
MIPVIPVYIEDVIEEVNQAMSAQVLSIIQANETAALGSTLIEQIRYSKSSFDELIETLAQADNSGTERYKKYPLTHLVQDVEIDRGQDVGLFGSSNLNVIFVHQTVNLYKMDDRDQKVFKPVLWPMYYGFMEQLKKSKWIFGSWAQTGEFRHQIIKHGFWGDRKLEGSKNILNDYVDALEIRNLQIKLNNSNC